MPSAANGPNASSGTITSPVAHLLPENRRAKKPSARRFNAGNQIARDVSPEATVEPFALAMRFRRPFGTPVFIRPAPALKRRAIFAISLRDKCLLNYRTALCFSRTANSIRPVTLRAGHVRSGRVLAFCLRRIHSKCESMDNSDTTHPWRA